MSAALGRGLLRKVFEGEGYVHRLEARAPTGQRTSAPYIPSPHKEFSGFAGVPQAYEQLPFKLLGLHLQPSCENLYSCLLSIEIFTSLFLGPK